MSTRLSARLAEARNRFLVLLRLVREGQLGTLTRILRNRLYSESLSLGLRRDVSAPAVEPSLHQSLVVRRLEPRDFSTFTELEPGLPRESVYNRMRAARLFKSGIETGYVALVGGAVAYMQYLIDASQNDKLATLFGATYPPLAEGEALLEHAFSLERYRGRGLLLRVMPQLIHEAEARGIRRIVTFASVDNTPMLKGCKACGFEPFTLRREKYRLFRQQVTFEPLPAKMPHPFETDEPTSRPD
jgi:GNAT superfamily N-acetyltransferase